MDTEQVILKELSAIPNIEIFVDTNWLFIHSMKENLNISDVVIRYLVVEEYYQNIGLYQEINKKKNFDYNNIPTLPMLRLYYEMQQKRAEFIKKISSIDVINSIYNFIDLIEKVDLNGFDINYPLEINQNFCLLDGAHRLALALYHGISKLKIFFHQGLNYTPNYSINWFEDMSMTKHIDVIKTNYIRILDKISCSYIISEISEDMINQIKEKFFAKKIDKNYLMNIKVDCLTSSKNFNSKVFFKLIPKTIECKTVYPEYFEKDNRPAFYNKYENKLIDYCNKNNITLLKEKGD